MNLPWQTLSKLEYDKQKLIDFFYREKDKQLRPYSYKGKEWPFYVMSPLEWKDYRDTLGTYIDLECKTYEFVYMPSGYVMDIHKDNYNLGSRIGILLDGKASLDFFDDDLKPTVSFDYSLPALFDIRVNHNVTNTDPGWRLSFFINFEETYEPKLKELEHLI